MLTENLKPDHRESFAPLIQDFEIDKVYNWFVLEFL